MEAIVVRAVTKIATDCPRKQGALKKQCRETLGRFISRRTTPDLASDVATCLVSRAYCVHTLHTRVRYSLPAAAQLPWGCAIFVRSALTNSASLRADRRQVLLSKRKN